MRAALLQLPGARTTHESRQVLRAAIRQVERADLYIAAVESMEVGDFEAVRVMRRLRTELDGLRQHLADLRARS